MPRVARRGRVQKREFSGGELAQDDRAGALESRHRLGVVVGNEAGERFRAGFGCKAGGIEDVFNPDRHAVKRPAKAPLARFPLQLGRDAARARAIDRGPRLYRAVEPIDARQRRVDQLDRRELALADQAGRLRERERVQLWHRVSPCLLAPAQSGPLASAHRGASHFLPLRWVSKNDAILGHNSKAAFSR